MNKTPAREKNDQEVLLDQLQRQVAAVFEKMPYDVPLLLFTDPPKNEVFIQTAREVIRTFRNISSKISLREYGLTHKLAKKYNVDRVPTLLFDPDRYPLRWLGVPIGEEGRTFLEMLLIMGYREPGLERETQKILERIKEPRAMQLFVSPTCPYCPQQAINAIKAVIARPELFSLEIIDIQVNPDLGDRYNAFGVPLTLANGIQIAQGAQPEELFAYSLEKMAEQTIYIPDNDAPLVETELAIVGGGPAGLTAGIYAARSGLKTVIVEKGALGGQVATTPVVENYPSFTQVGGKALVDLMVSHALQYLPIFQGEEVMEIRPGLPVELLTPRRKIQARAVLLATGAVYRHLGVPGEQRLAGRGVSYCSTCDGPLFKGKKVIMVGGGDSAVTEALHLHHLGVGVTLVHRKDTLRAQEHLVKSLQESALPVIWDTEIKEIKGTARVEEVVLYNNRTRELTSRPVDGVFIAIGYEPATALAQKIGAVLTPDGYIQHDARHRTNIPGVYSAGDVEGGFKQIVIAAGQGSEAALAIYEDLIHPYWRASNPAV
ncbi:MAG: FAD-dependent oxidoreductase [Deltaproteobacteria bacterium]|nr:FAD-dependent oxidoreductase [Deltaproteobacteria bacterium]